MAYIHIPSFTKKGSFTNDTEFVIVVDGVEHLISYKTLSDTFGNTPELLAQIQAEIIALKSIIDALPTENPAAPIALKISDTPIIDGIYKPTEAGTYPNAGGLVYDPTEGITYFIRTSGVWVKDVTPINFTPTGEVENGNTEAVSGGDVFEFFEENKINIETKIFNNQLLDPLNLTTQYIDISTGQVISNNNALLTDYIECFNKTELWFFSNLVTPWDSAIAFYDVNKNYISKSVFVNQNTKNNSLSIPNNAYYFKATVKHPNAEGDLNFDTAFLSFYPNKLDDNYVSLVENIDGHKTQYLPKLSTGINLFNGNNLPGYMDYQATGGYIISRDGLGGVSDYIYVKGQKKIYSYVNRTFGFGLFYSFYDENLNVIKVGEAIGQELKSGNYEIPNNAVWVRQGVLALNETRTDLSDVYIGFFPYKEEYKTHLQYGTNENIGYQVGKISRLPIEDDDAVPFVLTKNILNGGTYVALGDSITASSFSYAYKVADKFNMEIINFGSDGAHFTNFSDTTVDFSHWLVHNELPNAHSNNVIQNQIYKLLRMITPISDNVPETNVQTVFYSDYTYPVKGLGTLNKDDVKLITIAAGTNDSSSFIPIGDYDSIQNIPYNQLDKRTLWSAIKWAVIVLRKYIPNAKVVILTPIQRSNNLNGLIPYVNAELEASFVFGCPCVNQFQDVGIMGEIEAMDLRYTYDGLHPNEQGAIIQCGVVASKLNSYFRF